MKTLKVWSENRIIGPWVKKVMNLLVSRKTHQISHHFSKYLGSSIALSDELKDECYKIRHSVYCEELKFEDLKPGKLETDGFDIHSTHCLIKHIPTSAYAGTIRVIRTNNESQLLPIEKYCISSISDNNVHPKDFPRNEICELSRLAIPLQFRKRQVDKFKESATGAFNEHVYSESELRCFPFIAVGLYLSAASIAMHYDINHCFVMMEPRLARSLRFVGIPFEKIGPVVEYHGKRAPYYISRTLLMNSLSPGFKNMLNTIKKDISSQIKPLQN